MNAIESGGILVRDATPEDAVAISLVASIEDRLEAFAFGKRVREAARDSIDGSEEALVAEDDQGIIALYGVGHFDGAPHIGVPWLVVSDRMTRYPMAVIEEAKSKVEQWSERYAVLGNLVSAKNERSIRFLETIGFEMSDTISVNGHDFIKFSKAGKAVL